MLILRDLSTRHSPKNICPRWHTWQARRNRPLPPGLQPETPLSSQMWEPLNLTQQPEATPLLQVSEGWILQKAITSFHSSDTRDSLKKLEDRILWTGWLYLKDLTDWCSKYRKFEMGTGRTKEVLKSALWLWSRFLALLSLQFPETLPQLTVA